MKKNLSIATVLFTYNRPKHTEAVLDSLKNNDIRPEKLIVFQDGKKENTDVAQWESVNSIINNITWCNTETIVSSTNKGLSKSISQGITNVLERYDAVIVLEDDCVTHPKFMSYMLSALNKYAEDRRIFHINAYSWRTAIESNGNDAYFGGRAGSWGWGTWKDCWSLYKEDYKILSRIKSDEYTRRQFEIWGSDLEDYFLGNVYGYCDSWATFWAMTVIEQHGYCLTPYQSLVDNIGFDGTGVHCKASAEIKTDMLDENRQNELLLPDDVTFPADYEKIFPLIFKWTPNEKKLQCYYNLTLSWLRLKLSRKTMTDFLEKKGFFNVAIWGTGNLCDLLLKELGKNIHVEYLIESNPAINCYQNIPVKRIEGLDKNIQLIIVIPVYDIWEIREKVKQTGKEYIILGLDELIAEAMREN